MKLAAHQMDELSVKYLEEATMIKAWGRMASGGLGLGYGGCTLADGKPDSALTTEQFERINVEILRLPERPRVVIVNLYKLDNSIAETAIKMGDKRHNIERHQRSALNILYGALCTRSISE